MTDHSINMDISVDTHEQAEILESRLAQAGVDCSVGRQHGKWKVFAQFGPNEAAHVATIIKYELGEN